MILCFSPFHPPTVPPPKLLAPEEREAPPGFRVKYYFGRDPVRGLWEKDGMAR